MAFFFMPSSQAIGVFDSGIGGLSVWKEIVALLPNENIHYIADNGNCPYGPKSEQEIINLAERIVGFLLEKKCKLIVVACNTATAAAIDFLREKYSVPFVGMEPAVKPAATTSKTGTIGVLATEGTFRGRLFNETSRKFANDKNVYIQVGHGLVDIVENGKINTPETEELLKKYLEPMLEGGADRIVLGCTHYPFLKKPIEKILGNRAEIIDPSYAVAKRVQELLNANDLTNNSASTPMYSFCYTGNMENLTPVLSMMGYGSKQIKKISL
ncbi:MAG: glutamate racemase [Bacteroidota bacterium]